MTDTDYLMENDIHIAVGNTTNDTKGNILVGDSFSVMNGLPAVTQSRKTLREVVKKAGHAIALKVCEADVAKDGDIVCKNNSFVDPDNEVKEVYHQDNKVWVLPKGCGISINPSLMRRGIEVLHPATRLKVKKLLDACAEENLRVLILDRLRTVEKWRTHV